MKALSLFSGIGGIDLACEWAGIETVAFCEREPFPQKVLAKHWPGVPIYDDVCTLTKERLETDGIIGGGRTIDLIHGGYPCQPFSSAGERKGKEDERHLWPEVRRLITAIKPRWFVGENVSGHVSLGLDEVLLDLESEGYEARVFLFPAAAVGALHKRDRLFIVAHYEDKTFPDSASKRLERIVWEHRESPKSNRQAQIEGREQTNTIIGQALDGRIQWAVEPPVGRVANGIPQRVDRLKALGNAVVPQQIYPILAAIKQIGDMTREATP